MTATVKKRMETRGEGCAISCHICAHGCRMCEFCLRCLDCAWFASLLQVQLDVGRQIVNLCFSSSLLNRFRMSSYHCAVLGSHASNYRTGLCRAVTVHLGVSFSCPSLAASASPGAQVHASSQPCAAKQPLMSWTF